MAINAYKQFCKLSDLQFSEINIIANFTLITLLI